MADILLDEQSVPVIPSAGTGVIFIDTIASILGFRNDAGSVFGYSRNAAVTAQAGFASDTYVTNSGLVIPSWGMQAKTVLRWTLSASKSGAGVAQPVYTIRIGANQAVTDTARLALTGPAQTAIADIGTLNILVTVRSVGAAGVLQGSAWWNHRGTAANTTTSGTGFANDSTGHVEATGAGFDNSTLAGQFVGLSMNGGTSAAWTVTQVIAECDW